MRSWLLCPATAQVLLGLALLTWLITPPIRHLLEAGMGRHMLLQFPLGMLAGALLAASISQGARAGIARWNAHGISGLVLVAVALSLLMLPRLLDLAVRDATIEAGKFVGLLMAGAALRLSWHSAGLVVQGFFLGNVLPMMAVVGQLYIDSPLRLCNAYLLDDQVRLGQWLVVCAALLALIWLGHTTWRLVWRESAL
ncbi:MAG TPA: hypothetical protein PKH69_07155 [Thiobacillaceae bacterium]|nr:hypothetical protein [Thiobacillaceae bacterium]HNU63730.1 hypothetical protein [Thiobacillaceae bacterium]